jgi:D-amino-acid dehydrogenase
MARTLVAGAGIIGLLTAYELIKRGDDVTLLDMGEPGHAASAGNAGWICPSLSAPLAAPGLTWTSLRWMLKPNSPLAIDPRALPHLVPFLWRFWKSCNAREYSAGLQAVARLGTNTMERFDALADDGVAFEMHEDGLLFVFTTESALEHLLPDIEAMRSYGYPTPPPLSAREVLELEPTLSDAVTGGLYVKQDRHVRPETLARGMYDKIIALGGKFIRSRIRHVHSRGSTTYAVHTTTGDVEAERFVIAAGAWSGEVSAKFGFRVPIEAAKGYSITISQPAWTPNRPLYLSEAKVGVSPTDDALRFAGTLELSGIDTRLKPARLQAIRNAARKYFRAEAHGRTETEWAGMRPLAPDSLPVIGALPGRKNVFIATGHGMLGVTLAPSTGYALAEMMTNGASDVLAPFDPKRFGP